MESLLKNCSTQTRLCVAANITSPAETIHTHSVLEWKNKKPELHKQPVIFLLHAYK
jgi:16S rRNA (cytidine1402-2'-O)-methyltransferase